MKTNPTTKELEEFWQPEPISSHFSNENISDVQLIHIHERIEKIEKIINKQQRTARLIRRVLKLFA